MSQPPPAERLASSGSAAAVHEVVVDDDARFELKMVALPPKARVTLSAHTPAQFHDHRTFETEKAVYQCIARLNARTAIGLRGRVPDFLRAYDDPELPALLLQRPHGSSLGHVLPTLSPPACDELLSELTLTLRFLHVAGICHGTVSADNIIVQDDGEPSLVDFSLAKLEHRCTPHVWEQEKRADLVALGLIFLRDTWAKAKEAADGLLDDADASGAPVDQDQLIGNLCDIHEVSEALLTRIQQCVAEPCPHIAVVLDHRLSQRFGHAAAARMLCICILRCETSRLLSVIPPSSGPLPPAPDPSSAPLSDWQAWFRTLPSTADSLPRGGSAAGQEVDPYVIVELKMLAARRAARSQVPNALPASITTEQLYKTAIRELTEYVESPANEQVLELRYEFARHLESELDLDGALQECMGAVRSIVNGGDDGVEAMRYEVTGKLRNTIDELGRRLL
ncbi:5ec3d1ec-c06e-4f8f-bdde-6ff63ac63a3e [Neofusicoccum parvum]|uniref:5ec3d1ec-c06e-4f8f-bdde-6ff63ac63a3e n=1 Tax=Neofusicoccum parvum TaxID=310453 RepID=A0ACB5SBU5_9PEZI|nr:5ec3d1ec-c06e-4f8f-bdde-6ff63ac63a3e [Neofusicoccum parvum]